MCYQLRFGAQLRGWRLPCGQHCPTCPCVSTARGHTVMACVQKAEAWTWDVLPRGAVTLMIGIHRGESILTQKCQRAYLLNTSSGEDRAGGSGGFEFGSQDHISIAESRTGSDLPPSPLSVTMPAKARAPSEQASGKPLCRGQGPQKHSLEGQQPSPLLPSSKSPQNGLTMSSPRRKTCLL